MNPSNVIVTTPTGIHSVDLAIAASRAGAVGCINLEGFTDWEAAKTLWQRFARYGRGSAVVRIGPSQQQLVEAIASVVDFPWGGCILADATDERWAKCVDWLRALGQPIWLELVDAAEFSCVDRLQVERVVLKGNEAGGHVGEPTAFVLTQQWVRWSERRSGPPVPFWVQGGMGPHTAAAASVAGAAGVVLDSQLLLARESPLSVADRGMAARMDGAQSQCIGSRLGDSWRLYAPPTSSFFDKLGEVEDRLADEGQEGLVQRSAWRAELARQINEHELPHLACVGQDIVLAQDLASRYQTVGGIVRAICESATEHIPQVVEADPFSSECGMAASHGTRYPILQGPMTRVSDTPEFARAVSDAGGLPFLALALMREREAAELLDGAKRLLEGRSWGVGLLGFLPPEIRAEQMALVAKVRPPFALIAGGRPDQSKELEELGITTYLHVPSPGLLRMFLRDGARRFVFEGRECGGHVGPRSSFLLWETMVTELAERVRQQPEIAEQLHVVFAGGIHDRLSAAMAMSIAGPLLQCGAKVGLLMGTAYLATREAVATGAIVPRFQQEVFRTSRTVLFTTGPGHAIRCIETPYYHDFEAEKRRLRSAGKSREEIIRTLEMSNIGRLRIASKGLDRAADPSGLRRLESVSADDQITRGMYMVGQVASMHDHEITMAELHTDVCDGGREQLAMAGEKLSQSQVPAQIPRCDVAIIGMSCYYPGALSLDAYWHNILRKHYAVTEIPGSHWDWRLYYDPNPLTPDRIVSKWGGFLGDVLFDPLKYGITPRSVAAIEPMQLLLLETVREAIENAGYADRDFPRDRTAAILGVGGGGSPMAVGYGFRACLPLLDHVENVPVKADTIVELCADRLPEWTEDSFPGILLNVAVGRVANRFNFGGANYALDAACASSLAAVHACIRELELGTADVAVAMGADTVQTPYAYMAFSKTHALSPQGRCRPFDAAADGIVLSEGMGAVVLKRLADAERDGDRIYAVIRGVGSSSDGKDKGLTAPNAVGQRRALQRAYEKAGLSPATVGLIEAHGTGTVVGDRTEAEALSTTLREAGAGIQTCALGSVKSMIGHSKCAAGIAGLIKTTLALHHRVLPPTLVDTPNPRANFPESALYLNTEPRPWVHAEQHPRRAGVSAFGFGGTNVHVALEEYTGDYLATRRTPAWSDWTTELVVLRRPSVDALRGELEAVFSVLRDGARPRLSDIAASLWRQSSSDATHPVLAVVANSREQLIEYLATATRLIGEGKKEIADPRGIYYAAEPARQAGKLAVLFPGQGSQYPDMGADLALAFPIVQDALDQAAEYLRRQYGMNLGRLIYPPSWFTDDQRKDRERQLAKTDVAQPAVGAVSWSMWRLWQTVGIQADMFAGHSYGEYTALCAAGFLDTSQFFNLSARRGQVIHAVGGTTGGAMAAVIAEIDTVRDLIQDMTELTIANHNAPRQVVVSGPEQAIETLIEKCRSRDMSAQRLAVSCAFHSPAMRAAQTPFEESLRSVTWCHGDAPVYANTTAAPHTNDPQQICKQLVEHLTAPVRFVDQIEAMYADGARVFLEVGPQRHLTGLVERILESRPYTAVATDVTQKNGLTQFQQTIAQLLSHGVALELDALFSSRDCRTMAVSDWVKETGEPVYTPTTFVVNGTRSRLWNAPEPKLLGQAPRTGDVIKVEPTDPKSTERLPIQPQRTEGGSGKTTSAPSAIAKTATATSATDKSTTDKSTSAAAQRAASPVMATTSRVTMNTPTNVTSPTHATHSSNGDTNIHSPSKPAPVSALSTGSPTGAVDGVMLSFQQVMAKFLDTQREVMSRYLQPNAPLNGDGSMHDDFPSISRVALPSAGHDLDAGSRGGDASYDGDRPGEPRATAAPPAPVRAEPRADTFARGGVSTLSSDLDATSRPAPGGEADGAAGQPHASAPTATASTNTDEDGSSTGGSAMSMEAIAEKLIQLVSDRTGYPPEMLGLELDLEADLGIDSIKRVEILGDLAESLGLANDDDSTLDLEKLTTLRNLKGILGYLEDLLFNSEGPSSSDGAPAAGSAAAASPRADRGELQAQQEETVPIQRGRVELTDISWPQAPQLSAPSGGIIVTDDGRGIARELASRLTAFDVPCAVVRPDNTGQDGQQGLVCDLTDADQVTALAARLGEEWGRVAGVIHLAPLAPYDESAWAERSRQDVKSLYLLARTCERDLKEAADRGSAFFFAVSGMGGALGLETVSSMEPMGPGHGGLLGFTKCLAMEWDSVRVRAVDIDAGAEVETIVDRLLDELGSGGPTEVGHYGARRLTWQPAQAPLDLEAATQMELDEQSTVLITGGARGITAAISMELARRYRPRLILVGRSPLPPDEESADTAPLTEPAALKAALIERARRGGQAAAPAAIQAEYNALLRDREVRSNLRALRQTGATVEYHSLDVTDEAAMTKLLESVQQQHGALDGIVHGAGIIDDKLVRDKTPESFDRVYRTKVQGAENICKHVDFDQLKFCAFFSSIASRYGNRGQADYAAANEVLSKLAYELDRRYAARVFAVAWGPWAEIGMVADLERHLAARGVSLIPPAVGVQFFIEELLYGSKGDCEVLIAGGAQHLVTQTEGAQS